MTLIIASIGILFLAELFPDSLTKTQLSTFGFLFVYALIYDALNMAIKCRK